MIMEEEDVRVALLCEYLGHLPNPVVVLSVCREIDEDGTACQNSPIVIFSNHAFPQSEKSNALRHAEAWKSARVGNGRLRSSESMSGEEEMDWSEHRGLSDYWTWTTRTLLGDTLLVVEGTMVLDSSPSQAQTAEPPTPREHAAKSSSLSLPTPTHPKPFPPGFGLDLTASSTPTLEHNALFLSRSWSTSPLGPIDTWDAQLRGLVQIIMAAPFPVLVSYGPDYVLLYNEPYSKVIGKKHPSTLGMKYGEAWPEVWDALEPVIQAGYQGSVLNVDCQEMFLMRGARLEGILLGYAAILAYPIETYFSYSLIPIRDQNDMVCGLFIPNFDNTVRIVTERRIRSLHDISRCINGSLTQEKMVQDALDGMKQSNPRDMHFALFYIADNADRVSWPGGKAETGSDGVVESDRNSIRGSRGSFAERRPQKSLPSLRSESIASSGNQDRGVNFRLVGSYGIDIRSDNDGIPLEFPSVPDSEITPAHPINPITQLVLQVKSQDSALFIPDLDEIPSLSSLSNGNPFDDPPRAAIVLPIRSSVEDRLHGVMLLGLNTRAPWDEEYSNYIQLVKGLLATGLATIKLHEEDLARARYMAALNRQKNEELQSLLTHRTEELKTSELKFRSAFAACPAGIWIGGPDGGLWDINQAYFKMSGLALDAPLDDWIYRVHPDDLERVYEVFEQCKTKTVAIEYRFLPTDEEIAAGVTERWVEASGGPVYDDNGVIVMLSGALLDITQRRQHLMSQTQRADEALELKRLQDHFIDMLSHELRNPLSAICLSSDGVVDSLQTLAPRCSPEMAEELRDIVNDAGVIKLCTVHMRRLVDDVLALSKIDNNMLTVTPTASHPESMCLEVMDILQSETLTHDIICNFEVKQGYRALGVSWAELDSSRVQQVLINLLVNAIKFTAAGDKRIITLTLDATTARPCLPGESLTEVPTSFDRANRDEAGLVNLVFEVRDTGIGMTEAEIERVFQRFVQGSNRTHLTYGGSGLGLFICRRITQLLGGEISVHSKVGEGSVFAFFIPVHRSTLPVHHEAMSAPMQVHHSLTNQTITLSGNTLANPTPAIGTTANTSSRPRRSSSGLPKGGNIHVLLVEDNQISQKLLKKQLVRAGCSVVTANDGVEAVEYFLRNVDRDRSGTDDSRNNNPQIELILMDIEMPRKGGLEATQDIRSMEASGRLTSCIPIIAVSANARSGQIESMLNAGMNGFVSKPFQMTELLSKIEALTGKRPGQRQT